MSSDREQAWEAAKPRSSRHDKHGREELLVHPWLKTGDSQPRKVPRRQP